MRSLTGSIVISIFLSALAPAGVFAQEQRWAVRVAELEAKVEALEAALVDVQTTLAFVRVEPEPINGLAGPHWIFEGTNVHVRSGAGSTHGPCPSDPECALGRGLGNLIVGYNEGIPSQARLRSGMHNLVVGPEHVYISHGGFVAGRRNAIWGLGVSVSGGEDNVAIGTGTSVTGGRGNEASGEFASVSGGRNNVASGLGSSVSGGGRSEASGVNASVSGGGGNFATALFSSVSGGRNNAADALAASVSGGAGRTAAAEDNWAAGSLLEQD